MTGFAYDFAKMSMNEVAARWSNGYDVFEFGIDSPASKVPAVVAFDRMLAFSRACNPDLWAGQLRAEFAESLLRHEITNAVIYVEVRQVGKAAHIMHLAWYRYRYRIFTAIIEKNIVNEYCHGVYRAVDAILDDLERIRHREYSQTTAPPLSREGDMAEVIKYLWLKEEVSDGQ